MKTLFFEIISLGAIMTAQAQQNEWATVLDHYLVMENALVASNPEDAKTAMEKMHKNVLQLQAEAKGKNYEKEVKFLAAYLEAHSKATSLDDLRSGFEKISKSMIALAELKVFGKDALYVVYCPMKKASWLDDANTVKNPFFGKAMLTCGSVKKTIN
ncbi:DUF3347 domain-containing protein [Flavobacterium enshiense]|uniref:DUF3347 domain-containing protein n=1 Tax=Flavobacterium enshiense TaxID=1341165 RepID=UPI00345D547F